MPSPEEQLQTMLRNLEEKTGQPLAHWLAVVRASGLDKHGAIVKMLKGEHGFTHGYANLVAQSSKQPDDATAPPDPLQQQYAGKESLRPVYDRIADAVQGFGEDVELAAKKSYVSLRRKKQFALVQPSTKTRVDLGIQLKGVEPTGRLEAAGSWNGMVSHRVRLATAADVDSEVLGWLQDAYDAAG